MPLTNAEKMRRYRERHKDDADYIERRKAEQRRHYARHKDKHREWVTAYRETHPEKVKAWKKEQNQRYYIKTKLMILSE